MHSRECLDFLPRYLHHVPGVSQVVSYYQYVREIEFARAWWTPPLSPATALSVERSQIEELDLHALVSLTDHDDIQAGLNLGVTEDPSDTPVSVEWTVPYQRTILHLGVHNMPRTEAARWMTVMAGYTAAPAEPSLPSILQEFARVPGVLIVLNHPYWLEEGVDERHHKPALQRFLHECLSWIDALELNGTRTWTENTRVVELAEACGRPVISGGDRHACEPAACINLSNARTFPEFVSEIKAGYSSILFLPQYREPMPQRVLEAARDILRTYPEYPGRERWSDRIWYLGRDGIERTVAQICNGREPWLLSALAGVVHFFADARFRVALRMLLEGEETQ